MLDEVAICGSSYGSSCYFTKMCKDVFPYMNGLTYEFQFSDNDLLTMPFESFLRQGPKNCELLVTNLAETSS